MYLFTWGFPGGSDGKESASNAGDLGLIPQSGRSLGKRNGYPLQYSCLKNPMDSWLCWVFIAAWVFLSSCCYSVVLTAVAFLVVEHGL